MKQHINSWLDRASRERERATEALKHTDSSKRFSVGYWNGVLETLRRLSK